MDPGAFFMPTSDEIPEDVGFIGTRRDVSMLARTYIQSANVGAQEAVFKQNEDVIRGYTRLETLDNRTCPQCAFADGLYYTKDEKRPALPIHPCCRGLYIPKTVSFRELGLDIDELEDVARPWTLREDGPIGEGGKPIIGVGRINGTFEDWWNSLSDEDKARTGIGATRSALLQEGKLQWRDMVDKRTGRLIPLEELGFETKYGWPWKKFSTSRNTAIIMGPPQDVIDIVNTGKSILKGLPSPADDPRAFHDTLMQRLAEEVGLSKGAKLGSTGLGADMVFLASQRFPAAWVKRSDEFGPLYVEFSRERSYYLTGYIMGSERWMSVDSDLSTSVHEFSHRLDEVCPSLQRQFQRFHEYRCDGKSLESLLAAVSTVEDYKPTEMFRDGGYIDPYFGKQEGKKATELMPMAFQSILGYNEHSKSEKTNTGALLIELFTGDNELFSFTLGSLFKKWSM